MQGDGYAVSDGVAWSSGMSGRCFAFLGARGKAAMTRFPSPTAPATTPAWPSEAEQRAPYYLLAALLLAVLTGAATYTYLRQLERRSLPSLPAVIARQDIPQGSTIEEGMLAVETLPDLMLPAGHYQDIAPLVGRRSAVRISSGEVLLASKLAGSDESALSYQLADGKWAVDLPASWLISGVPGLIPGDRLDLMACQPGKGLETVGVIVSAVEVLSHDGASEHPDRLTLIVDLDQARALLYARANGYVILALLRPSGGGP
jgi:Flp pilus assembly protein CpaB